ncbi:class I adenylate cyclase [Maridesulfovibrio salexigens]|uniref:Putative adenylate cyclase n=1 Tax=Maridesulfovibrio salexigens (strain ATCC 14822 / DSM 2638 / NCIMB 8403 / VKM B-1763) TaxID=526222 RepID=C6BYH9_MARSD|nr:class I adenylate cyclase [Maridesulfovibrio salexigens]ACS78770.1 putative adenylate cyclase [Maridesulfovibrio salexigens DSM 2638]
MAETETHDTLLGELRRLNLYPPEERQLADLRYKIEGKFNREQTSPDAIESAKYAMLFYGLGLKAIELEAEQSGKISYAPVPEDTTEDICLDYLAQMGPCGRNLAASLICNRLLPFSKVKSWFSRQPVSTAIGVADRMLAIHDDDVPERIKFAESIIEHARKLDLHNSLDFFNKNGTRKGQLTFKSLSKFISGNYGKECRRHLREPESLEEISLCAESMPPYPDGEMVTDISFHLKTMDPIIMEKVLRAVERLADEIDDELLKEIIPLAQSPSLPLAKAAMDIITKFGGSRRGRIFAQIFNEAPKLRAELINRVPLLNSENLARFMNEISAGYHTPVLAVLYSTISEEDPQCFGNILNNVLKISRSKKKNSLKPVLAGIMEIDSLSEPTRPEMPKGKKVPGVDFIKQGGPIVLNIENKEQEQTGFKRIFGKAVAQSDSMPDIHTDGQITNQRLHKLNKWKSLSRGITIQNSIFSACEFKESFLEECIFKNCTFEGCTFSNTTFLESEFENCDFNSCSLDESIFYDCQLEACNFNTSHLDSAVTFLSNFKNCKFNAVAAPGTYFCRTRFSGTTFQTCDLREAFFYKVDIKGCDFAFSNFETTLFKDSNVNCSHFTQCNTGRCRASNVKSDLPEMLKAMQRTFAAKLSNRERHKKRSTGFGDINEYGRGVLHKAIKRWYALKDIEHCHACFAENNSRRLDWAQSKLDSKSRKLLKIIPALLHTNVFEIKSGLDPQTMSSRVCNYALSPQVIKLLDEFFPDIKYEISKESSTPIEAFMSIGSTGTIAQTPDSDLDCWVCCNFTGRSAESRQNLGVKLQAIEKWAMNEFGLEIHFFIMDTREIRDNLFGLSDEESSGSAQSAILKEEFYRTAVLLAGKPPLWWFTPPEAAEKAYADTKKKVALLKGKNFCVDLGNIPNIPVEEFFGASLWQIVKGIKSPFKSIMKFGLLELYTSDSKYSLLCEKLKKNIISGKRRIRRVDPYMRLYQDLANFYRANEKDEYIWLTAMALRLKCGLVSEKEILSTPSRAEEIELIDFTMKLSGEETGAFENFKDLSDFGSVAELGRRVNQFMVNTYMKVRGEQDKFPGVSITPEDLTRLGRIIFSAFAKRTNKILRLSLPGPRTHFFNSINISRTEDGKIWNIHGEYPDESGARNILTRIESGPDLNFMLVWLALNGLYNQEMQIKTDISSGPLREREIKKLFSELMRFFPPKKTFNVPIEETLNTERLTKGFFIVNLCVPPESKKVQEVHLVYSTNWGEVFCKPLKINMKLVETPEQYLKEELGTLCDGDIQLNQFVPQNAECPYLKIPVN